MIISCFVRMVPFRLEFLPIAVLIFLFLDNFIETASINQHLNITSYWWHLFLCVWVPVREPLCLFWRETHTKGLRTRSPTRPEVKRERRSERRQKKAVSRREQKRTIGMRGQSEKDTVSRKEQQRPVDRTAQSTEMKAGQRRTEEQKLERRLLRSADLQRPG